MLNYLIWIVVAAIYFPVFKIYYSPIFNELANGPVSFFRAFEKPWGDIADYTHAYFILPISIWLIWRKRTLLRELTSASERKGVAGIVFFIIFLFGLLLFNFGWRQGYQLIYTFSLIPVLFGLSGFLYGIKVLRLLAFPFFYLIFLVPPTAALLDSITLPMRHGVSVIAEHVLSLLNYPVARDGLLLSIGYNEIFMGQPCSGFRSLITMFALVLVYVYISKSSLATKIILTILIVPFAIFGNLIRVIALCLITFYFGEAAGQGFFHDFSGIVVFIITILGVIWVEFLIDRRQGITYGKVG